MTDSADDRRDGAPMSDGTGTMSVQLVLCVADSVWRAAGHLARVCACPRRTRITPAQMLLLLLLAVLYSSQCRHSQLRHYCRDRSW